MLIFLMVIYQNELYEVVPFEILHLLSANSIAVVTNPQSVLTQANHFDVIVKGGFNL